MLEYKLSLTKVRDFSEKEGRNPRILVAKMG
jgi:methylmalonyl-CoA mutase cobalamin-binding subunit